MGDLPERTVSKAASTPGGTITGLPYGLSYWLGALITALLAGLAVVLANPENFGLSPGLVTTLGLVAGLLGFFRGTLPNIQHLPQFRERELLRARAGVLPRDLRHKS